MSRQGFTAGQVLFRKGDPSHEMFYIVRGVIRLCETVTSAVRVPCRAPDHQPTDRELRCDRGLDVATRLCGRRPPANPQADQLWLRRGVSAGSSLGRKLLTRISSMNSLLGRSPHTPELGGGAADPIRQGRAIELDPPADVDLALQYGHRHKTPAPCSASPLGLAVLRHDRFAASAAAAAGSARGLGRPRSVWAMPSASSAPRRQGR
jgi:hypothetical protein